MPKTVAIQEAESRLREIISALSPGDEVVIESEGFPVARLTRERRASWPCQPGSARDTDHWMAPDFDAPLEDFREYMG